MSSVRGCHLTWEFSVESINSRTTTLIEASKQMFDYLASQSNCTWENVAQKLALFEANYYTERASLDFPQHVHTDPEIRAASVEASRRFSDVEVELEMRKDVFDKFVLIQSKLEDTVPSEIRRYIDRKVRTGQRNGLHLGEAERAVIETLSKEENQLEIDFSHHMNEENTILEFTKEELAGCPDDFLRSLSKAPSGNFQVTLKYPHYFPISEKATNPETRKALHIAFDSRCIDTNKPILKRLMEIRQQRAAILGFATHADYILDIRMAKSASTVANFIKNISEKLEPLRLREQARLLELKKEECELLNLPYSNRIEPWDFRYYLNMAKERDYFVDQQKLKVYFPLKAVKAGVLRLYQNLLGLTFALVNTTDVWHSDVELYSVCDSTTKTLMGYFYLDLHPRAGKYSHAAVFDLQPGCLRQSTTASGEGQCAGVERQLGIAAMVANFTGPTDKDPEAYLLHEEVETFLHEFGHLMHDLCSETDTALFSGTNVETDFVECPSQMLENWVWAEEGLKAIVGDATKPMPPDLMNSLLKSRTANAGFFYSRQLLMASFDQAIHTSRWKDDPEDVFAEFSNKMLNIAPAPGTCMPASFGHMAGGYDARYYGYMWSLVFSLDLYETRFRNALDGGCLSCTVGREYRRKILKPGGSKDAIEMLHDFLGRDPNDEAFLKLFGLKF